MAEPDGLTYIPDFLSGDEEKDLVRGLEELTYHEVRMFGVVARRTVTHFGWDYDYEGWKIHPTDPLPPFLDPIVRRVAEAAGVQREVLEQFLIARYPPGATIGWHRDAPMFGSPVVGLSLLSPATMKFRRKTGNLFESHKLTLEPRSLYILDGSVRKEWQHSIPKTKDLRYSITMRTIRGK